MGWIQQAPPSRKRFAPSAWGSEAQDLPGPGGTSCDLAPQKARSPRGQASINNPGVLRQARRDLALQGGRARQARGCTTLAARTCSSQDCQREDP